MRVYSLKNSVMKSHGGSVYVKRHSSQSRHQMGVQSGMGLLLSESMGAFAPVSVGEGMLKTVSRMEREKDQKMMEKLGSALGNMKVGKGTRGKSKKSSRFISF